VEEHIDGRAVAGGKFLLGLFVFHVQQVSESVNLSRDG
jgi:hypothetical protein